MQVIVGLGNPGPKYERNRHNIGMLAVDAIHRRHSGLSPWRKRFQAEVSEGMIAGHKVLLVKPMTFMNESGRAVGEALRFYKLSADDVSVFYDELDLPPAKVRIKRAGGAGGHNGIRSLDAHIGKDYRRVRLGIGHPGAKERVTGHVLGDFAKPDAAWLDPLLDAIADDIALLLDDKESAFMNRLHRAVEPEGTDKKAGRKADKAAPKTETATTGTKAPQVTTVTATPDQSKKGPLAAGLERLLGIKRDS